jgi:uncharacterized membrane protein (DUF4010 family)
VASADQRLSPSNPLELVPAFLFGALLAIVMVLSEALTAWFGDAGVLALAVASGFADVDAITLSLARMSTEDMAAFTAAVGMVVAAAVNTLSRAVWPLP